MRKIPNKECKIFLRGTSVHRGRGYGEDNTGGKEAKKHPGPIKPAALIYISHLGVPPFFFIISQARSELAADAPRRFLSLTSDSYGRFSNLYLFSNSNILLVAFAFGLAIIDQVQELLRTIVDLKIYYLVLLKRFGFTYFSIFYEFKKILSYLKVHQMLKHIVLSQKNVAKKKK